MQADADKVARIAERFRTERAIGCIVARAELSAEMELIEELAEKNRAAKQRIDAGAREEIDWVWLGYTIHNLYNAIENYCLRVAKFFENSLDQPTWRSDLINRMQIAIPNRRPVSR